jgi:hypothetical protein
MTAGDVDHYSAYDGWTVELDTGKEPLLLTLRGAFLVGFRLIRTAIAAWVASRLIVGEG